MKIEIKDEEFNELAQQLKTTPENVMKIFLDHAKSLPYYPVILEAIQKDKSLDSTLEKLIQNAAPAFLVGDLIKEIMGVHEYSFEDDGYSLKDGIIWFEISPGPDLAMSSLLLQFGSDPGIVATEYLDDLELDTELEALESEIWEKVARCRIFDDDDNHGHISFDLDGYFSYTLQIDTPGKFLNLPRVDEIDEVMQKIKKIILLHSKNQRIID